MSLLVSNYFNRRAIVGFIQRRYAALMFKGRQFVESGEANEMQDIIFERLQSVGDAALGPIALLEGGTVVIDKANGIVRLGQSRIWAGGYMHIVEAATLTGVPMTGVVAIGIAVTNTVITPSLDPDLKGIVPDTKSKGEPLSDRLRYDSVWAMAGNPFYPIITIIDGLIPNEKAPPANDSAEGLVERHIRETHGSHVIDGFFVSSGGFNSTTISQEYIISAGVLRAEGRRVQRSVDQRYPRVENPEVVRVNGELHNYPPDGIVLLNNGPIDSINLVTIVKSATRNITHQLAGGTDGLPDSPVFSIQSVTQGGKTFVEVDDWMRDGDGISWSPGGDEPDPGSTYTVNYRYTATVTPKAIGRQSITLENGVVGQPVTIQYGYKLPRVDIIAIDQAGSVVYLEGISTKYNPVAPDCPEALAPLVRVLNLWGIPPLIEDVDQRKMTEAEVRALLRVARDNSDLIAVLALQKDAQERDPSSSRGMFVDNFANDLQRDLGLDQDAAVDGGFLMLPIIPFPTTVDIGRDPISLPFVERVAISQPFRTASRKINEYQNFTPLPAAVTLNPAVDRWNETQSTSSSSSTSSFQQVFAYRPDLVGTPLYGTTSLKSSLSSSTSMSSTTQSLPFLRQTQVNFDIKLFGPGEVLDTVTFDRIDITASVTGSKQADAQGLLRGTFRVPPNVQAGTKEVVFRGKGGSVATTSFTGQGTLTIERYHTVTRTHTVATTIDPVAQSFILDTPRQVTAIKVEFTDRGSDRKHVVAEMRNMEGGLPGTVTYAEGSVPGTFAIGDPNVVQEANKTRIGFRYPTFVPSDAWRWVCLLTDDPKHSVAIAQLGNQSDGIGRGFDQRLQQWVRSNPALGDFADGSNGATWRALPDTDLTHEIIVAEYTALTRRVNIGSFKLSDVHPDGISDAMVLLLVDAPVAETRVQIELTRASGEVIRFEPNAPVRLDDYLTETVKIDMVLYGTPTLSPVVMPECQIIWGRLKSTATYISEANSIDLRNGAVKLRSIYEVFTPGTSSIALDTGNTSGWTQGTPIDVQAMGDGWVQREHLRSPFNLAESRVRIRLEGTPKYRPAARKLRQRATGV